MDPKLKSLLPSIGRIILAVALLVGLFIGGVYVGQLTKVDEYTIELKEANSKLIALMEKHLKAVESLENEDVVTRYIMKTNTKVFHTLANLLAESFINSSKEFKLPLGIVLNLGRVESTFKYDAVSEKDAIGIMQVEPKTWVETLVKEGIITSKRDLYDPVKNIRAGTYILRHYYDQCDEGDPMEYAITRYLGGVKNGHFDKVMRAVGEYYLFIR